jgi:hypothetical protein
MIPDSVASRPDPMRERVHRPRWNRQDAFALLALALVTMLVQAQYVGDPLQPLYGDLVNFFIPMFSFLGESLRSGHIPAWNPHQFAGAPFAGDPQSGWTYLLVMLPFVFLPIAGAVVAMNTLHLLVVGVATYLFGRSLGLNAGGACAAAICFEYTMLLQRTNCCPQIMFALTWLPVMLLAAEMGLRSRTPLGRAGWLLLGSLAVSQELAGWLGQGAYYQFMMAGGWIVFRSIFWPPDESWSLARRMRELSIVAAVIFGGGIILGMAALLPRLEYNQVSNVSGGVYHGPEASWAADFGGIAPNRLIPRLFSGYSVGEWLYAGAAAGMLAIVCPFARPRWRPWIFFAVAAALMLVLSIPEPTIVHRIVGLAPGFSTIHGHYMHRVLYALSFPLGMMAGATITAVTSGRMVPRAAYGVAVLVAIAAVAMTRPTTGGFEMYGAAAAAVVAAAALVLFSGASKISAHARALVAVAFAVVLFWDSSGRLMTTGQQLRENAFSGGFDQYLGDEGAVGFLHQADPAANRFLGFDPALLGPDLSIRQAYIGFYNESQGAPLIVTGDRATALGLDDLQGYNPVHPMRYVEWIRTLNGQPQLYRFGNVYPSGLDSPLLDLSNARYAVVRNDSVASDPVVAALAAEWPERFRDHTVRVLENPEAAPRAWLADEAWAVVPGGALEMLASGAADGRVVALVEEPALAFAPGGWGASDAPVTMTRPDSDRIHLTLSQPAGGPAMLVVSEVYDAGWRATIDGHAAPVVVVDHTLMGVPIAAGAREIVLRYDPPLLKVGIWVSLLALAGTLVVWALNGHRWLQGRRGA